MTRDGANRVGACGDAVLPALIAYVKDREGEREPARHENADLRNHLMTDANSDDVVDWFANTWV